MGVGKLVWAPTRFRSASFNEDIYLKLDDSGDLDLGTSDARLALLFWPDSTVSSPTTYRQMIAKWDGDLSNDTGYWMGYKPSDGSALFAANDGSATGVTANVAGVISNNYWNFMVVECDRNGDVVIYVNGTAVKSISIAARQNTWDAGENFNICRNNSFKGKIGFVAVGNAIFGADYALEEYYDIVCGKPRTLRSWIAAWTFGDSVVDLSGDYTLTASGTVTYSTGYPTSLELDFVHNISYDYDLGYIPLDSPLRAADGTGSINQGATKLRATLPFPAMNLLQKIALEGAWYQRSPIDFYLDQTKPKTFIGMIVAPPQFVQITDDWWRGTIELEEM